MFRMWGHVQDFREGQNHWQWNNVRRKIIDILLKLLSGRGMNT